MVVAGSSSKLEHNITVTFRWLFMKQFYITDTIFFQLILRGNYYIYLKDSEGVRHLEKNIKTFINAFIRHFNFICPRILTLRDEEQCMVPRTSR